MRRVQRGGATIAESLEAGAHLVAGSGSGMVRTAAQPSCLETEPSLMWYAAVVEMNAPRTGIGAGIGFRMPLTGGHQIRADAS